MTVSRAPSVDPRGHHGQHGQLRRWIALGFLGWHLDCQSWMLVALVYVYTVLYIPRTQCSLPSLLWVICMVIMVAGHPTMILALVLERHQIPQLRRRSRQGCKIHFSIFFHDFRVGPVAPHVLRRRTEPRLEVWQIGDTNMQKAGRDADSRYFPVLPGLHSACCSRASDSSVSYLCCRNQQISA